MSLNSQLYMLPEKLEALVKASLDDWKKNDKVRRLWQRDASVWTGTDEAQWLGWLDIAEKQLARSACRGGCLVARRLEEE